MSKKLESMALSELMELQTACEMLIKKYSNELTTYAEMTKDTGFYNISSTEKALFDKHKKLTTFIDSINNRIQLVLDEYILENS